MKIGFLGNTNNFPFIVADQMRALGCKVILFVDAPPSDFLNRPEQYTKEISYPYPSWIIEKPVLKKSYAVHFPRIFAKDVIREINKCDAVILNDYGHRFRKFIRKDIPSISMFSGVDLDVMGSYEAVKAMKLNHPRLRFIPQFLKKMYAKFSVNQLRKGISGASLISYFPEGLIPYGDEIIHEIFKDKPVERFSHLHVVTKGYELLPPANNRLLRIFCLTRFTWKLPLPPGVGALENKGGDIMIRAIAIFLKRTGLPLDIHFIEKGMHVEETKELIRSLGFENMVTWHKQMPFKELNDHISKSDVVFEQLGTHFISGGFYPMLQGRPLIGNARPEIIDRLTGEPTPVCHATTAEGAADWLEKLSADPALRRDIGIRSREYVLTHFDIKNETKYFLHFLRNLTGKGSAIQSN